MKELSVPPPEIADLDEEDVALAKSEVLTKEEVLRRRCQRLRRLMRIYKDYYWSLMEDVRRKHREYYWTFGMSPFKGEDEADEREHMDLVENGDANQGNRHSNGDHQNRNGVGDVEGNGAKLGLGFGGSYNMCLVGQCTSKAMPLTSYCHTHILSDPKQTLYKCCSHRLSGNRENQKASDPRSPAQSFKAHSTDPGIQCVKPILRTTIPPLCSTHLTKLERSVKQALRKGGVSAGSSTKLASKFHWVVTEYVRLIQSRRRAAASRSTIHLPMKDSHSPN